MTFSKEDLISKILKKKESKTRTSNDSSGIYPVLKHSGKKRGLLSPAQRRIYVLSQMNGQKDIAYNLPEVLKIKGEFTAEQAQNTIEQVVLRHDILRTAFVMEEGKIYQEVHEQVDFKVEHVKLAAREFDTWLQNFIRPFDLTQPCLLRCALVNTEEDRFLVFDSHHIIGDGFSAGIINREFALAAQGGKLSFTRFQYLDYVDWVDQMVASKVFKKQEEFWLKKLSGSIPVLDLPLDYARPDRKDFLGATVEFSLGELSTPLRALFRTEKVTLFTGLISAYAVFLSKITQQEDIFIATPVVNRPLPEMQNLPGMFVNTLPVITHPNSESGFIDFLHKVKMSAFDCQQNADCDISHIVEKLGIKRNAARNPLFDTLFVLQVKTLDMFNDSAIGIEPYPFNRGRSQFDLSLEAVERGEEIVFKLDYATALFSEKTIVRFRDQFLTLIENLIETPHAKIKELSLINQQQAQDLIQWESAIQQHQMHPISDVFEKIAAQRGDATALIFEGETLSYRDLAQKVQNLAFYLRSLGVGRGDYVCLLQERSFEMIIAIFAVIKTGAAYVPIDPDYPDERVKFTVENCGAKYLITQPEAAQQKTELIAQLPAEIISDISTHLEGNHKLETLNDVTDVMYVIYTSGTTGVPKGVMVEHRCLYALLNGNKKLDFSAEDRWVLFHSFAFDVSVWEIFASLLNGSSLLIPPKKITRDTQAFRRLV
ncbi:MAG: condensation domain-containing protein, partial [Cellvibrio sp.]